MRPLRPKQVAIFMACFYSLELYVLIFDFDRFSLFTFSSMSNAQGRNPFNVLVLRDTSARGWHADYREIVRIYSTYQHQRVNIGSWSGFALHSGEFVRGILLGDRQPSRTVGTQTDITDVNLDYFQVRPPD